MREDTYEKLCLRLALFILFYYIVVSLYEDINTVIELMNDGYEFSDFIEALRYEIVEFIVEACGGDAGHRTCQNLRIHIDIHNLHSGLHIFLSAYHPYSFREHLLFFS